MIVITLGMLYINTDNRTYIFIIYSIEWCIIIVYLFSMSTYDYTIREDRGMELETCRR